MEQYRQTLCFNTTAFESIAAESASHLHEMKSARSARFESGHKSFS